MPTGSWGWGIYTAVFAVIAFAAIAKESLEYIQLPPPGLAAPSSAPDAAAAAGASVELPLSSDRLYGTAAASVNTGAAAKV